MQVADLSLCEELYKLSGWRTGEVERDNPTESLYREANIICFRYDLGYLIRKAGNGAGVIKNGNGYTARRPNMYGAPENKDPLNGRIGWDADTPEDAMCVMLIELIKKGLMDVDAN